jgi:hypothetical protein
MPEQGIPPSGQNSEYIRVEDLDVPLRPLSDLFAELDEENQQPLDDSPYIVSIESANQLMLSAGNTGLQVDLRNAMLSRRDTNYLTAHFTPNMSLSLKPGEELDHTQRFALGANSLFSLLRNIDPNNEIGISLVGDASNMIMANAATKLLGEEYVEREDKSVKIKVSEYLRDLASEQEDAVKANERLQSIAQRYEKKSQQSGRKVTPWWAAYRGMT